MGKIFDPTRAFYRSYTPGAESASIATELRKDVTKSKRIGAIFRRADELVSAYRNVLTQEQIMEAKTSTWGRNSVEEYESRFISILGNCPVWEMTKERFDNVCDCISRNNPNWLKQFVSTTERRTQLYKKIQKKSNVA